MKDFHISRDSWHYKLNCKFMNEWGASEYLMKEYWEPHRLDFCSYWRVTLLRLIFLAVLLSIAAILIGALAVSVYTYPVDFAIGALKFIAIIVTGVAMLIAVAWLSQTKASMAKRAPRSLVMQRYAAYKSKVCPMINYED